MSSRGPVSGPPSGSSRARRALEAYLQETSRTEAQLRLRSSVALTPQPDRNTRKWTTWLAYIVLSAALLMVGTAAYKQTAAFSFAPPQRSLRTLKSPTIPTTSISVNAARHRSSWLTLWWFYPYSWQDNWTFDKTPPIVSKTGPAASAKRAETFLVKSMHGDAISDQVEVNSVHTSNAASAAPVRNPSNTGEAAIINNNLKQPVDQNKDNSTDFDASNLDSISVGNVVAAAVEVDASVANTNDNPAYSKLPADTSPGTMNSLNLNSCDSRSEVMLSDDQGESMVSSVSSSKMAQVALLPSMRSPLGWLSAPSCSPKDDCSKPEVQPQPDDAQNATLIVTPTSDLDTINATCAISSSVHTGSSQDVDQLASVPLVEHHASSQPLAQPKLEALTEEGGQLSLEQDSSAVHSKDASPGQSGPSNGYVHHNQAAQNSEHVPHAQQQAAIVLSRVSPGRGSAISPLIGWLWFTQSAAWSPPEGRIRDGDGRDASEHLDTSASVQLLRLQLQRLQAGMQQLLEWGGAQGAGVGASLVQAAGHRGVVSGLKTRIEQAQGLVTSSGLMLAVIVLLALAWVRSHQRALHCALKAVAGSESKCREGERAREELRQELMRLTIQIEGGRGTADKLEKLQHENEEFRRLTITMMNHNGELKSKLQNERQEHGRAMASNDALQAQLLELEANNQDLDNVLQQLQFELETLQSQQRLAQADICSKKSMIDTLQHSLLVNGDDNSTLSHKNAQLEAEKARLLEQVEKLQFELQACKRQLVDAVDIAKALQSGLALMLKLNPRDKEVTTAVKKLVNELKAAQATCEKQKYQLQLQKDMLETKEGELAAACMRADEKEKELFFTACERRGLKDELERAIKQHQALKKQLEDKDAAIRDLNAQLSACGFTPRQSGNFTPRHSGSFRRSLQQSLTMPVRREQSSSTPTKSPWQRDTSPTPDASSPINPISSISEHVIGTCTAEAGMPVPCSPGQEAGVPSRAVPVPRASGTGTGEGDREGGQLKPLDSATELVMQGMPVPVAAQQLRHKSTPPQLGPGSTSQQMASGTAAAVPPIPKDGNTDLTPGEVPEPLLKAALPHDTNMPVPTGNGGEPMPLSPFAMHAQQALGRGVLAAGLLESPMKGYPLKHVGPSVARNAGELDAEPGSCNVHVAGDNATQAMDTLSPSSMPAVAKQALPLGLSEKVALTGAAGTAANNAPCSQALLNGHLSSDLLDGMAAPNLDGMFTPSKLGFASNHDMQGANGHLSCIAHNAAGIAALVSELQHGMAQLDPPQGSATSRYHHAVQVAEGIPPLPSPVTPAPDLTFPSHCPSTSGSQTVPQHSGVLTPRQSVEAPDMLTLSVHHSFASSNSSSHSAPFTPVASLCTPATAWQPLALANSELQPFSALPAASSAHSQSSCSTALTLVASLCGSDTGCALVLERAVSGGSISGPGNSISDQAVSGGANPADARVNQATSSALFSLPAAACLLPSPVQPASQPNMPAGGSTGGPLQPLRIVPRLQLHSILAQQQDDDARRLPVFFQTTPSCGSSHALDSPSPFGSWRGTPTSSCPCTPILACTPPAGTPANGPKTASSNAPHPGALLHPDHQPKSSCGILYAPSTDRDNCEQGHQDLVGSNNPQLLGYMSDACQDGAMSARSTCTPRRRLKLTHRGSQSASTTPRSLSPMDSRGPSPSSGSQAPSPLLTPRHSPRPSPHASPRASPPASMSGSKRAASSGSIEKGSPDWDEATSQRLLSPRTTPNFSLSWNATGPTGLRAVISPEADTCAAPLLCIASSPGSAALAAAATASHAMVQAPPVSSAANISPSGFPVTPEIASLQPTPHTPATCNASPPDHPAPLSPMQSTPPHHTRTPLDRHQMTTSPIPFLALPVPSTLLHAGTSNTPLPFSQRAPQQPSGSSCASSPGSPPAKVHTPILISSASPTPMPQRRSRRASHTDATFSHTSHPSWKGPLSHCSQPPQSARERCSLDTSSTTTLPRTNASTPGPLALLARLASADTALALSGTPPRSKTSLSPSQPCTGPRSPSPPPYAASPVRSSHPALTAHQAAALALLGAASPSAPASSVSMNASSAPNTPGRAMSELSATSSLSSCHASPSPCTSRAHITWNPLAAESIELPQGVSFLWQPAD